MTDEQFIKACNSASLWFVAYYMELFLDNREKLGDLAMKENIIGEIYEEGLISSYEGVRARANALYRIVRGGRVVEALTRAAESDRLKDENRPAYDRAGDLLARIKKGTISL